MNKFSVAQSQGTLRPMLRLALPALAEEMLILAVTWTDWWLTGHFFQFDGDETKAAMSLMGYTMWLIPSMFAAIAIGAMALVARWVGSGDTERASRVANQAFIIGVVLAVLFTGVLIVWGDDFISVMQLKSVAAEYAWQYLAIMIPVVPLIMCAQVGAACLRGAGDMVTGFSAKLVVVFLNIGISTALVTGWGFLPQVGWKGLAIGTAVGHAVGGVIILTVLMRGRAGLKLNRAQLRPDWPLIGKVLRIGLPSGFDMAALLVSQLLFVALINSMGEASAAAHGLAVQIEACAYLPGAAFQVAAATIAGQFLGAQRPQRAAEGVLICLAAGATLMCASGLGLYFYGEQFALFFTGDGSDPTTGNASELLRIIALAMPSLAIVMVVTGGLRGAGDTFWPFIYTLIGFFVFRIPLAIFLCFETFEVPLVNWDIQGLGLGVSGAWYAMGIDLLVRGFLVGGRFMHGGWKNLKV